LTPKPEEEQEEEEDDDEEDDEEEEDEGELNAKGGRKPTRARGTLNSGP